MTMNKKKDLVGKYVLRGSLREGHAVAMLVTSVSSTTVATSKCAVDIHYGKGPFKTRIVMAKTAYYHALYLDGDEVDCKVIKKDSFTRLFNYAKEIEEKTEGLKGILRNME